MNGSSSQAEFLTEGSDEGERLDRFLARHAEGGLSRTRIKGLIEAGQAEVEGAVVLEAGRVLRAGQRVRLTVPPPAPASPVAQALPLAIVYEDDDL